MKHTAKKQRATAKSAPPAPAKSTEPPLETPEEGAGNNDDGAGNVDERELPSELRDADAVAREKRPPTNTVPDRPQDPARPSYQEPHPKDRIVNE